MNPEIENAKLKIEKSDGAAALRFFNFQFSIFNSLSGEGTR
jgi:hypothetical protein